MDDVIQRLVEIDRKCVERVEKAKAKKLDAQTNMNEKRKEIYDGFVLEQNQKIEDYKMSVKETEDPEVCNQLEIIIEDLEEILYG